MKIFIVIVRGKRIFFSVPLTLFHATFVLLIAQSVPPRRQCRRGPAANKKKSIITYHTTGHSTSKHTIIDRVDLVIW
jgi:hypothetical protein